MQTSHWPFFNSDALAVQCCPVQTSHCGFKIAAAAATWIHEGTYLIFWISLRGIPVEYKLDAFNMPRTGTTLCHPKIGYVDLSVISLLTHKLPFHLWSTLMEITPTFPGYQTRNSLWHPKFNSYNCNMFFTKIQLIQSLTRPTTHAAFSTFTTFSLLTIYSTRVLQHQKQTKYSMLQIKNFLCCAVKKKFRYSFVLPKKYSVREINNFPKRYIFTKSSKVVYN